MHARANSSHTVVQPCSHDMICCTSAGAYTVVQRTNASTCIAPHMSCMRRNHSCVAPRKAEEVVARCVVPAEGVPVDRQVIVADLREGRQGKAIGGGCWGPDSLHRVIGLLCRCAVLRASCMSVHAFMHPDTYLHIEMQTCVWTCTYT